MNFRLRMDRPGRNERLRRYFPFRRSPLAIAIVALLDAAVLVPAVITWHEAAAGWRDADTLFDLVAAIFTSAWLLGWMIAPVLLSVSLLLLLFGREVVAARPGIVELGIGLPGLVLSVPYQASQIRNLRFVQPSAQAGTAWRGDHFVFDYTAHPIEFGSQVRRTDLLAVQAALESACGVRFASAQTAQTASAGSILVEAGANEDRVRPTGAEPPLVAAEQGAAEQGAAEQGAATAAVDAKSPGWLSVAVLVISNLIPFIGAVAWGWRLSDVMVLYWAESAVIGFYNVLKIGVIGKWAGLFVGLFFLGHFGGFMAVHFLFVYSLFVSGPHATGEVPLSEVAMLFYSLWPALLAMFVSHGVSFFANFIGRQEHRTTTLQQQMKAPYTRIVFMHVVLILGGGAAMALGSTTLVLVLIIVAKTALDVMAHWKSHAAARST